MTNSPALNKDGSPVRYPGEFVRVIIGSTIHGLSVKDTDDLDLMGICIPKPEQTIGLSQPFEQHVWRTQPEGHPSGPGDIDLTVYSLRKFLRLAANGNPTLLNLLFVQPKDRHIDSDLACELRDLTDKIVSREAAARYRGYLRAQRERLIGVRGQKHTGGARRAKYMAEAGWDTKYAMHMVRLGVQGVELLHTGKISLPIQEPLRSQIMDVRLGNVTQDYAVEWAESLEAQLDDLENSSDLRPEPDRKALEKWLVEVQMDSWSS